MANQPMTKSAIALKPVFHIALILILPSLCAQAAPEYFGGAGEGYSASSQGSAIELGWRMFTAPMAVCGKAAGEIELVSSMPTIALVTGDTFSLQELRVDAIDRHGNFVERVPITVGLPLIEDEFLEYRPYDLELIAQKPGDLRLEIAGYCVPTSRLYLSLAVTEARRISLGSFEIAIPSGWRHRREAESDQGMMTSVDHPNGSGTLKFKSLTAPRVVPRETLRNMTNVDSSIALDWRRWGDFSGYQYAYIEDGTFYRQWWLTRQEELLFVVYSGESQDDSETEVINEIVASLTSTGGPFPD